MMNQQTRKRLIWSFAGALTIVVMVSAGVLATRQGPIRRHEPVHPVTDTLPPIISKVRNLEIVRATIENQGQPSAQAVLEVKNKSDVAVTSFAITFGENSFGKDGGLDSDEPVAAIEPYGTTKVQIALTSLESGVPLILAAATYADKTEEGQDVVLEVIHNQRARAKAEREAKKGEPKR